MSQAVCLTHFFIMTYPSLPPAPLTEWLLSFMGLRMRLRVTGDSMLPGLKAGDLVLADKKAYAQALPECGDIVVALHPIKQDLIIIKRVAELTNEGAIYLLSDNPEGSDSRQFGAVTLKHVLAKVTSYSAA